MAKSATLGMPRIGKNGEVSLAVSDFIDKKITKGQLLAIGKKVREENFQMQIDSNIDIIPCNDFSFFDHVLDATVFLGNIPRKYYWEGGLVPLEIYFAMVTGQQREKFDVTPMNISRWFNTRYLYVVPEFSDPIEFAYSDNKHVLEYLEAKQNFKIKTRPAFFGPVSYLLMGKIASDDVHEINKHSLIDEILPVYEELIVNCKRLGITDIQFDEPMLTQDLTREDQNIYKDFYNKLAEKNHDNVSINIVTSYGEIGNNLECAMSMPVSSIHLDLCSNPNQLDEVLSLIPKTMSLSLGLVDANNIWINNLKNSVEIAKKVINKLGTERVIIAPSSSLFLCPNDINQEKQIPEEIKGLLSFSKQKLEEINLITKILNSKKENFDDVLVENAKKIEKLKQKNIKINQDYSNKLNYVFLEKNNRSLPFNERIKLQKEKIFNNKMPLFPITTNGSLPYKNIKSTENYSKDYIKIQEDLNIDVISDGEFNRKNNIEFLASNLEGVFICQNSYVQSFGTIFNNPIIIYDIPVIKKNTYLDLAKSLIKISKKPIKINVCGAITFVNESFALDEIPRYVFQILVADIIKKEIQELEKIGIQIIGIDEENFLQKLPLRNDHVIDELNKLISIFKYICKDIANITQIHTKINHVNFEDFLENIAKIDTDVLLINSSRYNKELFDLFISYRYPGHISFGIYDTLSNRIPTYQEMLILIKKHIRCVDIDHIWLSTDYGFKYKNREDFISIMKDISEIVKELRHT